MDEFDLLDKLVEESWKARALKLQEELATAIGDSQAARISILQEQADLRKRLDQMERLIQGLGSGLRNGSIYDQDRPYPYPHNDSTFRDRMLKELNGSPNKQPRPWR